MNHPRPLSPDAPAQIWLIPPHILLLSARLITILCAVAEDRDIPAGFVAGV